MNTFPGSRSKTEFQDNFPADIEGEREKQGKKREIDRKRKKSGIEISIKEKERAKKKKRTEETVIIKGKEIAKKKIAKMK